MPLSSGACRLILRESQGQRGFSLTGNAGHWRRTSRILEATRSLRDALVGERPNTREQNECAGALALRRTGHWKATFSSKSDLDDTRSYGYI